MAFDWQRARDTLELAERDLEELGSDFADEELKFYVDAKVEALRALFAAPAPDLAALVYKLELFIADDAHEYADARALVEAMLADARGLAASA